MDELAAHLTDWIHAQVAGGGGKGVVFGLSGGIDSAVVGALAMRAFPGEALGVIMPCHSDPQDAEDAALVARQLGVPSLTVELGPVYDLLLSSIGTVSPGMPQSRLAAANLKPRLRMTTLYALANERGFHVVGTGNRSELYVGYFTKWGDGGCDLLPLGSLTKSEVRDLARHLGVPQPVIDKPPSAGLWAAQTDEAEMGLTYEELDAYLLTGEAPAHVERKAGAMHEVSVHKRELPPIAPKPGA